MNLKFLLPVLFVLIIIILASVTDVGFFSNLFKKQPNLLNSPPACTMEAKLCPDGSAVGRTGPNCEFAVCPTPAPVAGKSGIKGTAMLGPFCPVEKNPPDPNCADRPYKTALVATNANGES